MKNWYVYWSRPAGREWLEIKEFRFRDRFPDEAEALAFAVAKRLEGRPVQAVVLGRHEVLDTCLSLFLDRQFQS